MHARTDCCNETANGTCIVAVSIEVGALPHLLALGRGRTHVTAMTEVHEADKSLFTIIVKLTCVNEYQLNELRGSGRYTRKMRG